ncbi:MAG: hypothetical protein R3264_02760 [Anaerolineae bacterium]|nr:hypothetical protein [Anaerolineae bacterium]
MSQPIKLILFAGAILFLLCSTFFAVVIYIPSLQASPEAQIAAITAPEEVHTGQNAARFITLVIVMMGGVVASHIFDVARTSGPTINVISELTKMFSSSRFVMALVVTPLIFNSVYLIIGTNPETIGDYLLAFQNGFFWESVLGGLSRGFSN